MVISTMDQLIAAFRPPEGIGKVAATAKAAGVDHSAFYLAGRPGAAAAPSPGLAGAALTTYAGQVPFPTAVGGTNIYLARMEGTHAGNIGGFSIYDRLWHNSGFTITTTTAETVNSPTWPARDVNGATAGEGVMVAIEVSSAVGGGAISNTTLSYTNSAGTAGRTATMPSFPATAVAGTFVPFVLQAGDTGIRSVQSLTKGTTYLSGTIHLVAFRHISTLPMPLANVPVSLDAIGLGMPRMYDSSVPFIVYKVVGTALGALSAIITYAQG